MLHQFTWSHFLIVASILTLLWYLMLMLTIFRRDITGFFSGYRLAENQPRQKKKSFSNEARSEVNPTVMGTSRLPEGLQVTSMSDLNFGGDPADDGKLGLLPDVLQELKDIFFVLETENGDKEEFFSLVSIVREKYGAIASHPNIAQVNDFIRQHAPFTISQQELDNIWN